MNTEKDKAYYHLPGLFEFYELYSAFLPMYREHREYSMIGAISAPYTALPRTVSGAADVWGSATMTPVMCWR